MPRSTGRSGVSISETGNTTTSGETFTAVVSDTNGLLSANGTGVSGAGTKTLTVTGSLTQVNADLATLTDSDGVTPSDTLTVNASDSFGNAATAKTIAVTVNGLPVVAAPATAVVGVGQPGAIGGISVSETGNTSGETFTAVVSDTNGLLSATGTGVSGSGGKTLTATGSLAQVNADLATLKDTDGTIPSDTLTINTSDSLGNTTAQTVAVTVNGLPVIAAPTTAVVSVGKAGAISGVSISETGNTGGTETFTVSLNDNNGLLSASGTGVSGSGSKTLTVTGSLTQVNADLATLADTDSTAPSDTIGIRATDKFGNAVGPTRIAVAVNGPPVITAPATATVSIAGGTPIGGVSLSETGNTTTGETFTAVVADSNGLLSATGAGVSGSGAKTLTITGTLSQVNAALATLQDNDPVPSSDTITVNATDSFGAAATQASIGITVSGQLYTLTPGVDVITAGSGNDAFQASTSTLNSRDQLDGGGGSNRINLIGGGVFDLGAPKLFNSIQTVGASEGQAASGSLGDTRQIVYLRDGAAETLNVGAANVTAANPNPAAITIYGGTGADTINLGSGMDTVVLGGTQEVVKAGSGTALISSVAADAGTLVNGSGNVGNTVIEITDGGAAALNSATTDVTVRLDLATNLTLSGMSFVTAIGSSGADTITAGATNQVLSGAGGSDTLIGFSGFGDTFRDLSANLNGDTIQSFGGNDVINLTDVMSSTFSLNATPNGSNTTLSINDGSDHAATINLVGSFTTSMFQYAPDSATGTNVFLKS